MKSAIAKRSVIIGGHKTSVSLEEPFWRALREMADAQDVTVSHLLRQIDLERHSSNMSSAIRVYVLENLRTSQDLIPNGVSHKAGHGSLRPNLR
jgi:predicted DNA-binding ribbon-helix-helix protein